MLKLKQISETVLKLLHVTNPKVLWAILGVLLLLIAAPAYYLINRGDNKQEGGSSTSSAFKIPPEAYKDLEKRNEGKCAGVFEVVNLESDESDYCTYGPEATYRNAVKRGSEIRVPGDGVQCTGDNTSGLRVQAIYAHAEDKPDRYDELKDYFQKIADNASNSVMASAKKTNGQATLKWVTDESCDITIAKVKLRATQDDSFSETINAVQKADFDDPSKIYLIWTEADLVCGLATYSTDDNPDPNKNINSRGTVSSYSRVDKPCWGESELHEIMHNMGAVQDSAPHSTKAGHCTDGYDVMCYGDGGQGSQTSGCNRIIDQYLLDCSNDDYFSANPEAGSYLATRWNLFNSNYLVTNKTLPPDPSDTIPPPKPYKVEVFDVTQDGFKIKWKLPGTEDIDKIHVEVNRGVKVVLRGAATETYSIGSVKPGTTYKARVITFDANNNQSISEEVSFTTLATPVQEPGSIIPHDLKIKSINGSVVTLTAVIDRVPDSRTAYVIWRSTGVGYSSYRFSPTDTPKTYEFVDEFVYPQTVVNYHLRVQGDNGSEIARTNEIPLNFTGVHESNPPSAPTGFALKQDQSGGYYVQYDQMSDDSGTVHHYGYAVTGPGGYTYNLSQTNRLLSPTSLQSGNTYTVTARVFDIWGNASSPAVNDFTIP